MAGIFNDIHQLLSVDRFWGTTNNLVSVASPGGMALTYSLLLMMTRCFCQLIKAIPSLVLANSLRAVLREADQSPLIHQMAITNSGSSHWAWAQSTTLISPLGPVFGVVQPSHIYLDVILYFCLL